MLDVHGDMRIVELGNSVNLRENKNRESGESGCMKLDRRNY